TGLPRAAHPRLSRFDLLVPPHAAGTGATVPRDRRRSARLRLLRPRRARRVLGEQLGGASGRVLAPAGDRPRRRARPLARRRRGATAGDRGARTGGAAGAGWLSFGSGATAAAAARQRPALPHGAGLGDATAGRG